MLSGYQYCHDIPLATTFHISRPIRAYSEPYAIALYANTCTICQFMVYKFHVLSSLCSPHASTEPRNPGPWMKFQFYSRDCISGIPDNQLLATEYEERAIVMNRWKAVVAILVVLSVSCLASRSFGMPTVSIPFDSVDEPHGFRLIDRSAAISFVQKHGKLLLLEWTDNGINEYVMHRWSTTVPFKVDCVVANKMDNGDYLLSWVELDNRLASICLVVLRYSTEYGVVRCFEVREPFICQNKYNNISNLSVHIIGDDDILFIYNNTNEKLWTWSTLSNELYGKAHAMRISNGVIQYVKQLNNPGKYFSLPCDAIVSNDGSFKLLWEQCDSLTDTWRKYYITRFSSEAEIVGRTSNVATIKGPKLNTAGCIWSFNAQFVDNGDLVQVHTLRYSGATEGILGNKYYSNCLIVELYDLSGNVIDNYKIDRIPMLVSSKYMKYIETQDMFRFGTIVYDVKDKGKYLVYMGVSRNNIVERKIRICNDRSVRRKPFIIEQPTSDYLYWLEMTDKNADLLRLSISSN